MTKSLIFLSLVPALCWGLMPVAATKSKARPIEQLIGTTLTAVIFSIGVYIATKQVTTVTVFCICFLSGCFWSIAQYLQFHMINILPVSTAMPISNGSQLIFTTLIGAVFFHEWYSTKSILIGSIALVLIISGIIFTSYQEQKSHVEAAPKIAKENIFCLLISSFFFSIYVTLPRFFNISGVSILFPQAIGMFLTSLLLVAWKREIKIKNVVRNIPTGLLWSSANISLFMLIPKLGISLSFTFSQLSVIVSIYAGLYFLKDKKTKKEQAGIITGTILFIIGILMVSNIKN